MKDKLAPILAWVKSNLISVICVAVAVIALPTMYFFGSGMEAKQRAKVETEIKKQAGDLASTTVDYALEPVTPTEKGFTIKMPPNQATTQAIQLLLVKTAEQVGGVRERVVAFNREGKAPLVEGLFPKPAQAIDEPALAEAMAKGFIAAHTDMLRKHGGGSPPDVGDVEQRLKEFEFRERNALAAGRADGKLSADDEADLTRRLTAERLQIYLSRAAELRFYAHPGVFVGLEPWKETSPPSLEQCWEWQWLTWVHEDILRAVSKANEEQSLLRGPVKRIERIRVEPATHAAQTLAADPTAPVPLDPSKSLSGRFGPNGLFDIRYADVTMLVSSADLPRVLDAIVTTNLMTVVGVEVNAAEEAADDVRLGYIYTRGGEHIARVRLRIETVWLRAWTGELMPDEAKSRLGFEGAPPPGQAPGEPTGGDPGAGAGQPPPTPAAPPDRGDKKVGPRIKG